MTSKVVVAVHVAMLMVGLLLLSGGACPRECLDNTQCLRSCDCVNRTTDLRTSCTMGFICTADEVCEGAYQDMSCDEMCGRYQANNQCGRDRCSSNEQCTRFASCSLLNEQGAPTGQVIDCKYEFGCDVQDSETCDPRSTLQDAQLCTLGLPCVPPN
jgi:hypothetical protein